MTVEEFVKPSSGPRPQFISTFAVIPSKLVQKVPRWISGLNGIAHDPVHPSRRNVVSRKTKRRVVKEQLLKAGDFAGRFDVVHHGENNASHRVTQR